MNADKVVSGVGGEILGYNLYMYCNNNPVAYEDSTGMRAVTVLSNASGPLSNMGSKDFGVIRKIGHDLMKLNKENTSEQAVLQANYVSAYKNTLVIKIPGYSGASFGVIAVGNKVENINLVKHEYGHKVQLDNRGVINYTTDIAIPSVTANVLQRIGKLPYDYYGSPWESEADELGGAYRTHDNKPWPEEAYDSYGDLIKLFFE